MRAVTIPSRCRATASRSRSRISSLLPTAGRLSARRPIPPARNPPLTRLGGNKNGHHRRDALPHRCPAGAVASGGVPCQLGHPLHPSGRPGIDEPTTHCSMGGGLSAPPGRPAGAGALADMAGEMTTVDGGGAMCDGAAAGREMGAKGRAGKIRRGPRGSTWHWPLMTRHY